jgi:hypothetical protein
VNQKMTEHTMTKSKRKKDKQEWIAFATKPFLVGISTSYLSRWVRFSVYLISGSTMLIFSYI